jgi:hypothetical protein
MQKPEMETLAPRIEKLPKQNYWCSKLHFTAKASRLMKELAQVSKMRRGNWRKVD